MCKQEVRQTHPTEQRRRPVVRTWFGASAESNRPESDDREWIAQAWLRIIRRSLDLPSPDLGFESSPAVGTITVSSPARVKPLAKLNRRKPYWKQIKPFNFLLTCHVKRLGHPPGVKPDRFHLIAPYDTDSRQWLKKNWIDQYSEKEFRITTTAAHGDRHTARVKTYGDVLMEYEYHPESKCADANGNPCSKQTVGLLQRRHVRIDQVKYIGKESNSLEEVESGYRSRFSSPAVTCQFKETANA